MISYLNHTRLLRPEQFLIRALICQLKKDSLMIMYSISMTIFFIFSDLEALVFVSYTLDARFIIAKKAVISYSYIREMMTLCWLRQVGDDMQYICIYDGDGRPGLSHCIYIMCISLVDLLMTYLVYYLIVFKVTDLTVWVLHYIKLA